MSACEVEGSLFVFPTQAKSFNTRSYKNSAANCFRMRSNKKNQGEGV